MIEAIKDIYNRMTNLVSRCVTQGEAIYENGKIFLKVRAGTGELRDSIEQLCQYGFRSMPKKGALGLIWSQAGERDNASTGLIDDKRYGQTLTDGQVSMYDSEGSYITMDDAGNITLFCSTKFTININGTLYEFTDQKLQANSADIQADTISLKNHTHSQDDDSHGDTEQETNSPTP